MNIQIKITGLNLDNYAQKYTIKRIEEIFSRRGYDIVEQISEDGYTIDMICEKEERKIFSDD